MAGGSRRLLLEFCQARCPSELFLEGSGALNVHLGVVDQQQPIGALRL